MPLSAADRSSPQVQILTRRSASGLDLYGQQMLLEEEQIRLGRDRLHHRNIEAILNNLLASKYVGPLTQLLLDSWRQAMSGRPGKHSHLFELFADEEQVRTAAAEALVLVLTQCPPDQGLKRRAAAALVGRRVEFTLYLLNPAMQSSWHVQAVSLLQRSPEGGLEKSWRRLTSKGFGYALQHYTPLTYLERQCLGRLFLESIAQVCPLVRVVTRRRGFGYPQAEVEFTPEYYEVLDRWRKVRASDRYVPVWAPMLVPPRDWAGKQDEGGYLRLLSDVMPCDPKFWQRDTGRASPCVWAAVNELQRHPMSFDLGMVDTLTECWERGLPLGSLPKRERMEWPGPPKGGKHTTSDRTYWHQIHMFNADRRVDGVRVRTIHALMLVERLQKLGAEELYWPQHYDYRGRAYPRGIQLSYHGPDHIRSLLQFADRVPLARHWAAFAYVLGEHVGLPPEQGPRSTWLEEHTDLVDAIGTAPLRHIEILRRFKNPWRAAQACREFHAWTLDPDHRTGLVAQLDQTNSGYGHVACLLRDRWLAEATNVTGTRRSDLYQLVLDEVLAKLKSGPWSSDELAVIANWWVEQGIPRSLVKACVMPRIYGCSHLTVQNRVVEHLREVVGEERLPEGPRLIGVGVMLARLLYMETRRLVPTVHELEQFIAKWGRLWVQHGHDPHWYTPNGLRVNQYNRESRSKHITLPVAGRKLTMTEQVADFDSRSMPKNWRGTTADYVHSLDAAFLQQFVAQWGSISSAPLVAIHDCFGTTLDQLETLRDELPPAFGRFHQEPWLDRLAADQRAVLGEAPDVPRVGTLDAEDIGTSPYLFS